jgi:5-formyltetrahydrofolate cyclo-ligase
MKSASEKKSIRNGLLAQRRALAEDQVNSLSALVLERLVQLEIFQSAGMILSYLDHDNEVATSTLVRRLLEKNRPVAVPCVNTENEMFWSLLQDMNDLKIGKHRILAPKLPKPCPIPQDTLCVVPGVAWSFNGYRIGYGGGHFDRFLSSFNGVSVGLAYQFQVLGELPIEPHDQPVDFLLTESASYGRLEG